MRIPVYQYLKTKDAFHQKLWARITLVLQYRILNPTPKSQRQVIPSHFWEKQSRGGHLSCKDNLEGYNTIIKLRIYTATYTNISYEKAKKI